MVELLSNSNVVLPRMFYNTSSTIINLNEEVKNQPAFAENM
jgi:hypothetical protein